MMFGEFQRWIPRLHASLAACNEFLKVTSSITPAELLAPSMATEPYDQNTCAFPYLIKDFLRFRFGFDDSQVVLARVAFRKC